MLNSETRHNQPRSALDYLVQVMLWTVIAGFLVWVIGIPILVFISWLTGGPIVHGAEQPPPTPAEIKAKFDTALALAKAKRERELLTAMGCFRNIETAVKTAEKLGKKLILWVGLKCEDYPELRKEFADCVHCHADTFGGDSTPRIVVTATDGKQYRVERGDLSIKSVRHAMGE